MQVSRHNEDEVGDLEEELLGVGEERVSRGTLTKIYRLKRDLLAIKRAVAPLVEVCNRLMRYDFDLIPDDTRPYFRDVLDHVILINEMSTTCASSWRRPSRSTCR